MKGLSYVLGFIAVVVGVLVSLGTLSGGEGQKILGDLGTGGTALVALIGAAVAAFRKTIPSAGAKTLINAGFIAATGFLGFLTQIGVNSPALTTVASFLTAILPFALSLVTVFLQHAQAKATS